MELLTLLLRRVNLLTYVLAVFSLAISIAGYQDQPRLFDLICLAYIVLGYPFFKASCEVTEAIGCQGKGRGR